MRILKPLIALCIACLVAGCPHVIPKPKGYFGPTQPMMRVVDDINQNNQAIPTLWASLGYKATVVDTEQYLCACYRYVELNPVRAGIVAAPHEYRWSSYAANALGTTDPLVIPHERYDALGRDGRTRQAAYRALFGEALSDSTLADIRHATNTGWALGSKRFRDEVAVLLARRTEPAAKGRQRVIRNAV